MAGTSFGGLGGGGGSSVVNMPLATASAAGRVVFPNGAGEAELSIASNLSTSAPTIGITKAAGLAGDVVPITTGGMISLTDWSAAIGSANLVPGLTYYLSSTVAGGLTVVPPIGDGLYAVRIGTAISTTDLDVEIEMIFPTFGLGLLAIQQTGERLLTETTSDYLAV